MPIKVGNVVEGTVTGITNFGAFVQLQEGQTGLVHISEISKDYVSKVSDYLKKDQKVKVKIIGIDKKGKISLSIKQASPKKSSNQPIEIDWSKKRRTQRNMSFEEKINRFLKDSNERQEQLKNRGNKKNNAFRGR
ncbi:S1 RNA-binding domain-containing protein [Caldisalinibacter kiritimatiensis]|uniref:RNA binding protein n=1 Tax=Caldisalinibacter kiritimatiensis TaxID=1304284 RepID=R1CR41_9FIRM|nr:S1 RNA-binding domain-containing protein [Caldisalinibacter kiritimatiensis]EOD01141.1 RNA binding protein [Caldisalinibacter kiritimatiensis]